MRSDGVFKSLVLFDDKLASQLAIIDTRQTGIQKDAPNSEMLRNHYVFEHRFFLNTSSFDGEFCSI